VIHVDFEPEKLPADKKSEWEAWTAKAAEATRRVIDAWETWKSKAPPGTSFEFTFEESIWGEWKDWLLANVFHDKCAYCETPKVRDNFHAEHFRPKGRVTCRVAGRKGLQRGTCTDGAGRTIQHPGYFWLAYHWLNLLPACALCNSGAGKKDQFPVESPAHVLLVQVRREELEKLTRRPIDSKIWKDFFYLDPQDLDAREGRLLLHPYLDEPENELVFGDVGVVAARDNSAKATHSIEVYDLMADELCRARQAAQDRARMLYYAALAAQPPGTPIATMRANARRAVTVYLDSRSPYSAAVRDYIALLS
jgi:hypothetical protein